MVFRLFLHHGNLNLKKITWNNSDGPPPIPGISGKVIVWRLFNGIVLEICFTKIIIIEKINSSVNNFSALSL